MPDDADDAVGDRLESTNVAGGVHGQWPDHAKDATRSRVRDLSEDRQPGSLRVVRPGHDDARMRVTHESEEGPALSERYGSVRVEGLASHRAR